jgi:myo-inositol 2-dehydrogenase / D-chiro-inositol 1-dehydrogenase
MDVLHFGLVGYGAWGSCHAQAIRETPGCGLRAICAPTEDTRKRASSESEAGIHSDFRELVARSDIDIVDIVVPNYLHEEIACAALDNGKHVLLEKPMSISVASCDRIIEAARRSQRLLLVGHEMRYSDMYIQMREMIRTGQIGDPRYVLIDLWRRPYRAGAGGWRSDPKRVGNWMLEEPVHFFDAAAWFLDSAGKPSSVYASGNRMDPAGSFRADICDNFTAVVRYPNGAYAVISQTLAAVEHHLSIKVFGSKALIRAEWHAELDRSEKPSYFLETSHAGSLKRLSVSETPGELFELRKEIAAMMHAVRDGRPLPITPEEGRRAVMLCLESQRSMETCSVVGLTSFGEKSG